MVDDSGGRLAIHFGFNAWGEKFSPWDKDAEIGGLIARELGDDVRRAPMVLEGGSVISDGAGTILTTEQCLLAVTATRRSRRARSRSCWPSTSGAERIVWLGQGLVEDRDTDGHVDLIAAFTPDRRMLIQTVPDRNPNYERCAENAQRLSAAGIETIEIPFLPYAEVAGERVAAGYLNLYICNGAVIVPVTETEFDDEAMAIIGDAFPGRAVVPVPGATIAYGGGGPHCITQQVPAV